MPTVPPPSRDSLVRSFTSRDFASIREELGSLITSTRPEVWTDFFQSNLGVSLIDMLALVGDIVTLGQDIAALEIFLATAERYESALRFANSVGYKPRAIEAAEVLVDLQTIPASVFANGATIPAGQFLNGPNGLRYELLEDQVIPPGASSFQMSLFEGESFEDQFSAGAVPDFEAITTEENVVQDSWVVYVGSTSDPANIWTEVDSLSLQTEASKVYETELTSDGKLLVRFGDDIRGQIPGATITIQYRTASGDAGNQALNTISGAVNATVLVTLASISLNFANTTERATGGDDAEDVADLKANVPAYLRSADRIITIADYDNYARQVSGVAQAISGPLRTSFTANVVEVNVWGEELVDFTSESPVNGRRSTLPYTRFAVLESARVNDLQAFFAPRTLLTVGTVVTRREVAWADIYLSSVRYQSGFDPDDVHEAITQAVLDVFENSGGFIIAIADLYNAIDNVDGVVRFRIERIVFERETPAPATGTIRMEGVSPLGASVRISDGVDTKDFEVNKGGALTIPTAIPVDPGTPDQTAIFANKLKDAIEANLNMRVTIKFDASGEMFLFLENRSNGTLGNVTMLAQNGWLGGGGGVNELAGMAGGTDTAATLLTDYRNDQDPDPDPYPVGPDYDPGEPFVSGGPAWDDDGFLPYEELQDLVFPNVVAQRNFYNDVFLYNNEILYDSTGGETTPPQVINLRRLVFELQPDS